MNKSENYKDKNKGLDFIVTIYWVFFQQYLYFNLFYILMTYKTIYCFRGFLNSPLLPSKIPIQCSLQT